MLCWVMVHEFVVGCVSRSYVMLCWIMVYVIIVGCISWSHCDSKWVVNFCFIFCGFWRCLLCILYGNGCIIFIWWIDEVWGTFIYTTVEHSNDGRCFVFHNHAHFFILRYTHRPVSQPIDHLVKQKWF